MLTRNVKVGAAAYSYQVYVPAKLQGKQKLPVIVFLHGINQRGVGGVVLAANENPKVVSERLGHSSITFTMDTYSHVLPEMQ